MRITSLLVENYRNVRFAEAHDLPDFIVIGGGNGCGKSGLLEAIFFAKQAAVLDASNPTEGRNVIAADAESCRVSLSLAFNETDRSFAKQHLKMQCPGDAVLDVRFLRNDPYPVVNCPLVVRYLLESFQAGTRNSPGFFDYFHADRRIQEQRLASINAALTLAQWREILTGRDDKYKSNKQYLVAVKLQDLQDYQDVTARGGTYEGGRWKRFALFFNEFFSPLEFIDVNLRSNPFQFIVASPSGVIDIDDLSSGEKQIFNTYLHFHQLQPQGAVILFDEPDIHLHPEFARRYIQVLKRQAEGNQFWITTHSPDMMLAVAVDSLYTVSKVPLEQGRSQFFRVVDDVARHDLIREVMGATGLIGVHRKVVFVEGEQASVDVGFYETLYPPNLYDVEFVPAASNAVVTKIAERVNELLSSAVGFRNITALWTETATQQAVTYHH